jgi:large subunit ribosomal protein L17
MPTPKKGKRFGRDPKHQRLIFRTLTCQILEHEKVTTTLAKAKAIRPHVEKMITKGKIGGLHNHRAIVSYVGNKDVAQKVVTDLAKRYEERPGGYVRIMKLGKRSGDAAPMAIIELVQ